MIDPRNPLLEISGLTKRFGGVEALVGVDFVVHRHEVVALVGDNAAGKSTLARTLAGVVAPDEGSIRLKGKEVSLSSPIIALRHGIASVFQETSLCDNLDVVSNIFLGREVFDHRLLDDEEMELRARSYLDRLGARIPDLRVPLRRLTAGQRQCVAVARTLVSDPDLVILDEPTASMSIAQTAEVLMHVARLRDLGIGVVYISHNLTDVVTIADRVEVFRHGRNNGSFVAPDLNAEDIIAAITGASRVAL
ncbi:MAG: ATP-binding cassette domain-containing protein [Schaalia hyovaginalis]|uniref:ATP-binding cassette domain-containing protein n=1 Tax=Schaalia hyovaginalis TaxID=29316 RepID=UPI002A755CF5|nr:ATP-binding cassette domain-containing protein [Schaalia hyovaginalis]MDY3093513.1 ATP-binding cassette domain-containing protein [Schaalia hyovaginalis]